MTQQYRLFFLATLVTIGSHNSTALRADRLPVSYNSLPVPYNKSTSYEAIREEFKKNLYRCQVGLMDYEEYMSFIAPYLQEAEKTLSIVRHLAAEQSLPEQVCYDYFRALINYNVACFHSHAIPNPYTQSIANEQGDRLRAIITQIQCKELIKGLNAELEFAKTAVLLQRANAAYYENLSSNAKLRIWFYSFIAPRK